MAHRFAKVSEEEIEEAFFYPSDLVNTKTTIHEYNQETEKLLLHEHELTMCSLNSLFHELHFHLQHQCYVKYRSHFQISVTFLRTSISKSSLYLRKGKRECIASIKLARIRGSCN